MLRKVEAVRPEGFTLTDCVVFTKLSCGLKRSISDPSNTALRSIKSTLLGHQSDASIYGARSSDVIKKTSRRVWDARQGLAC